MGYAIRWSTNLRLMLGLCRLVGTDPWGNAYYESLTKTPRRWVIYKGIAEASKVPPLWHAWLHHTIKDVPQTTRIYKWQQDHQPNLTGTPYAYKPTPFAEQKKKRTYQSWTPS